MDTKKGLLWASAGAIGVAGLVTSMIFLFGTFNETVVRLLLSTVTIGWFGMTASLSMHKDSALVANNAIAFAHTVAGWTTAAVGTGLFMHLIWWDLDSVLGSEVKWKLAFTFLSLSWMLVWVAQLRHSQATNAAVVWLSRISITILVIIEVMVITLLWNAGKDFGEFFYRLLATLTALAVTGSLVQFIVKKVIKNSTPAATA